MNRLKIVVCLLVCLLITTSCGVQSRQDKVLETLGTPIDEAFYTHGGFQDYTDFGVYSYSSLKLERNEYFVAITHEDMETLGEYLDNFEQWIETFRQNDPSDVLVVNYAFDRSIIDESDFFYLYEKEDSSKFSCYDLWIADAQTNRVYYFHNNI